MKPTTHCLPLILHFISGNRYVASIGRIYCRYKLTFNIACPRAKRFQPANSSRLFAECYPYGSPRSPYSIQCARVSPAIDLCPPTSTFDLFFHFVEGGYFPDLTQRQHSNATDSQRKAILARKFTSFHNILRQRRCLTVRLLNSMHPCVPTHNAISAKMYVDTCRGCLSP